MSIPTTETKPDCFHSSVRPQARNIRQLIETAGPRERHEFLHSLIERSSVNNNYFFQLLLSAVLLTLGLVADLPLLIFVAAVCAPVINPLLGMVVAGAKPDLKHLLKSSLYALFTVLVFFGVGWLVMRFDPSTFEQLKNSQFFALNNTWLEWLVLAVIAIISVWLFLYRNGFPPVIPSTVLVYLIFLPITYAGLLFAQGQGKSFLPLLASSGFRLLICLLLMILTMWVIGFSPRKAIGWILFGVALLGAALLFFEVRGSSPVAAQPTPEPTVRSLAALPSLEPTSPPSPTLAPSATPLPSATAIPTQTSLPTETPEPTQTPTEELLKARVMAVSGLVVRESPDMGSLILAYLNYGEEVTLLEEQVYEQGINWEKIQLSDGTIGWSAAQFLK